MKRRTLRGLYSPELLESRIAPATIIVTSLADDGGGALKTLREAIVEANGTAATDTITFDPTILPGTITLAGAAEIDITGTLTIKGPGIDRLTISGANASRIFDIADGDNAVLHPTTISGLTLLDGNGSGNGGAIRSTESLTLSKVVIASSVASVSGGGVGVATTGKVRIDNTHFIGNAAGTTGGGLFANADGGIAITKCLVSGNTSGSTGGGLYLHGIPTAANILIDSTTISGNTATAGAGGGLAIFRENAGAATVKNSTFTGNTANTNGGALRLLDGQITVDRCVFTRNTAGTDGGAIADIGIVSLAIKNSRFDGNTADQGGAIELAGGHPVSVTGSLFTANTSTLSTGGAIHAQVAIVLTVKTSTFAGNTAATDGGAIAIGDAGSSLLLASSILSGNTAIDGGGVFAKEGAKLTVTGGSFFGNAASGEGGGIHTEGIAGNAVNVSITGTLFQGNRAASGGAVDTDGDGTVLIKSARVLGNHATGFGGGMYLRTTTTLLVQSSLFQHNVADDDGGALLLRTTGATSARILSSKLLDNFCGDEGGGIAISAGALEIKSSTITGNIALSKGGGVSQNTGTATFVGTKVVGNWAPVSPNIFP